MEEFGRQSNGHRDLHLQLDLYQNRNNFRSYSSNSYSQPSFYRNFDAQFPYDFDRKLKKAKTISVSSSLSKVWWFNDPEFKRKTRVSGYRALAFQGKVQESFRKSLKWLKDRFIHG